MDSIGLTQSVIIPASSQPVLPVNNQQSSPAKDSQPVVDNGAQILPADGIPDQVGYNAQVAEQKRTETIVKVSQQLANQYVISDQTFSLFKDATGQYITRFTNLRNGKVTYIPEPTLLKLAASSGSATVPLLKIQA